jgi:hypothetical protein
MVMNPFLTDQLVRAREQETLVRAEAPEVRVERPPRPARRRRLRVTARALPKVSALIRAWL